MTLDLGSLTTLEGGPLWSPPRPAFGFSASDWTLRLFRPYLESTNPGATDLRNLLRNLSESQNRELNRHFGPAVLAELSEISQESDAGLFFEDLLALGQRCEANDRLDLAMNIYTLLREGTGVPAVEARATARIQAIQGVGPGGARAEFLLRRLAREASDPTLILSMGLAGAAFRVSRLSMLGRLAASPTASAFTRGFGARATASLGAFFVESTTFTLAGRGLNEAFGRPQDWGPRALGRDWMTGSLTLGSLKLFGWAGGRLYQRALGAESLATLARPSFVQGLFQQGSMLAGILSAHSLEGAVGLREQRDGATTLVDSLATLLQFHVAGRLSHHAFGEGWRSWEHGMELHTESLAQRLPGPPPGFGELGSRMATPQGLHFSLATGEPGDSVRRPQNMFMEGNGEGKQEPLPAPGTERAREAAPQPVENSSAFPVGAQQLEVALREFLNMHPHAATVFELSAPQNGGGSAGTILMINRRVTEMFGYTEAEAIGLSLRTFMHQKDLPFFARLSQDLMRNGTLDLREVRYRRKDGSALWCDTSGVVKQVNGRTLGFAFLEDITVRRQAQAALEASEVRNRALIKAIPDLIFRIRRDMTFLDVHFPQDGLFVLPAEMLIGLRVNDLPIPEELKQFGIDTISGVFESGVFNRVEYELPMPDGSRRYQEARVSPSGPNEVVIIVRDTTDLKRAEQNRIAAERLDTVQLIGRGLAHDANNALTATSGYLTMARMTLEQLHGIMRIVAKHPELEQNAPLADALQRQLLRLSRLADRSIGGTSSAVLPQNSAEVLAEAAKVLEKVVRDLDTAEQQSGRIAALLTGFRELTAEPQAGPPFDLHNLLNPQELRMILGSGRELDMRLSGDPWQVPGPRESVHRVVLNLVGNARDAMEGRPNPILTVETEKVRLTEADLENLRAHHLGIPSLPAGDFMRLRVRDTGSGIEPEALGRIFEPYFSTKAKGLDHSGHSGLGLAITRKIVMDAGGFITVESRVGEGTTFDVYLPRVGGSAALDEAPLSERVSRTPILIVDDEPLILSTIARNLEFMGFETVHQAETKAEALRLLQEHPEIGGMIFDHTLKDGSGLELLREVRSQRPDFPALLHTGYNAEGFRRELGEFGEPLQKPSSTSQIQEALTRVLENFFQRRNGNHR